MAEDDLDPRIANRLIELAQSNVQAGGRPFSCVIVKGDEIVAEGVNLVAQTLDATAHAEIVAIRQACGNLRSEHLEGCVVYALAHPCPMCLTALYYVSPDKVVFLVERGEYSPFYSDSRKYFDFSTLYDELVKPWQERRLPMRYTSGGHAAVDVYRTWANTNADTDASEI